MPERPAVPGGPQALRDPCVRLRGDLPLGTHPKDPDPQEGQVPLLQLRHLADHHEAERLLGLAARLRAKDYAVPVRVLPPKGERDQRGTNQQLPGGDAGPSGEVAEHPAAERVVRIPGPGSHHRQRNRRESHEVLLWRCRGKCRRKSHQWDAGLR